MDEAVEQVSKLAKLSVNAYDFLVWHPKLKSWILLYIKIGLSVDSEIVKCM